VTDTPHHIDSTELSQAGITPRQNTLREVGVSSEIPACLPVVGFAQFWFMQTAPVEGLVVFQRASVVSAAPRCPAARAVAVVPAACIEEHSG
jgi:hypothetical protein